MKSKLCLILTTIVAWSLPGVALAGANAIDSETTRFQVAPGRTVARGGEPATQNEKLQYAQREQQFQNLERFEGGQYIYVGTAILIVLIIILVVLLLR